MKSYAELTTVRLTDAGAAYHGLPAGEVGTVVNHYPTVCAVLFPGWVAPRPCLPGEIEPLETPCPS